MLRYQCLWYKIESGLVYLQQKKFYMHIECLKVLLV